jgi:hypothetical protein
VAPDIPQWLDEGIAKFYEVPRGQRGLNQPLLDRLLARITSERWQPDLRRLEQFSPTYNMTLDDYAEAWAWTHWLMESRPESLGVLRGYLTDLRREGTATPLSVRLTALAERPDAALVEHVRRLESGTQ